MRERESIYFADVTANTFEHQPEGYVMFKTGKWAWLARLCWSWLKKMGALQQYATPVRTYRYSIADKQKITDAMLAALSGVLDRGESVSDYAFVMGAREFSDLLHAASFTQHLGPHFTLSAGPYRHGSYRGEWRDVPVHVVASITGIAAIPKVIIEKSRAAA